MSGKSEIRKVRIRHLEFMDKIYIHSSGKMIYYLNEHSWFARVNPFKTVSMEKNQSGFLGRRESLAAKTLEMELVPEGAGTQHSLLTALPCCLLDSHEGSCLSHCFRSASQHLSNLITCPGKPSAEGVSN